VATKKLTINEIPIDDLIPTPDNPRVLHTKTDDFLELVNSVKGQGVLVPVLARPHPTEAGKYDMRYGARRLEAARIAGLATVPTIVRELSDEEAFERTFVENYAREDLSPIEEGNAVATLLEKYRGDAKAVAAKMGHSEKWVYLRAHLKKLIPQWRKRASLHGDVSVGHLALIARLPEAAQKQLHARHRWGVGNRSLSDLEKWLNELFVHALAGAPFALPDVTLDKKAGACASCPKRTSRRGQRELWHEEGDDIGKADRCLDSKCWARKHAAHVRAREKALKAQHKDLVILAGTHADYYTVQDLKKKHGSAYGGYIENYRKATADETGSRPALIITGDHAGELRWIKPKEKASRSAGPKKPPMTLKERRAVLERKRGFEVLKGLGEQVARLTLNSLPLRDGKRDTDLVVRLAAAFGTEHTLNEECNVRGPGWGRFWPQPWKQLAAKDCDFQELLWERVRAVLVARITYTGPVTQTPEWKIRDAKHVAQLCGIDLKPLRKAAAETYPQPKSWKGLNADGTPKAKKQLTTKDTKKLKVNVAQAPPPVDGIELKPIPGVCQVCGCTEYNPCPGGCAWTDETRTLCTACAEG